MATATKSGFGRAKTRGTRDHAAPVTATVKGQGRAQAFRVAGVQMASGPNVAANLNEAGRLIEAAVAQGARLVALPEYFAIMGMRATDKVKVREKDGDSMVVDPWGTVLDRLPRGSGVVVASVNPAYQASLRKSLPALTHRVIHRV